MTTIDPDEFLYAGNQVYITEMFERFCENPGSVDLRWQEFFDGLSDRRDSRLGGELAPLGHPQTPQSLDKPIFPS